jgi:hypothetical protein
MINQGGQHDIRAVVFRPMNALVNSKKQESEKFREPISERFPITDSQQIRRLRYKTENIAPDCFIWA